MKVKSTFLFCLILLKFIFLILNEFFLTILWLIFFKKVAPRLKWFQVTAEFCNYSTKLLEQKTLLKLMIWKIHWNGLLAFLVLQLWKLLPNCQTNKFNCSEFAHFKASLFYIFCWFARKKILRIYNEHTRRLESYIFKICFKRFIRNMSSS